MDPISDLKPDQFNRVMKWAIIGNLVLAVLGAAGGVALVWVPIHFLAKFW